mgnify:CR=1 FL=1
MQCRLSSPGLTTNLSRASQRYATGQDRELLQPQAWAVSRAGVIPVAQGSPVEPASWKSWYVSSPRFSSRCHHSLTWMLSQRRREEHMQASLRAAFLPSPTADAVSHATTTGHHTRLAPSHGSHVDDSFSWTNFWSSLPVGALCQRGCVVVLCLVCARGCVPWCAPVACCVCWLWCHGACMTS